MKLTGPQTQQLHTALLDAFRTRSALEQMARFALNGIPSGVSFGSPTVTVVKRSSRYTNAKVVLIGESGVGKSGLALRLAQNTWRETGSTHGMEVWQLKWDTEDGIRKTGYGIRRTGYGIRRTATR